MKERVIIHVATRHPGFLSLADDGEQRFLVVAVGVLGHGVGELGPVLPGVGVLDILHVRVGAGHEDAGERRLGLPVRVVAERPVDHLAEVLGRRVQAPDGLSQARLGGQFLFKRLAVQLHVDPEGGPELGLASGNQHPHHLLVLTSLVAAAGAALTAAASALASSVARSSFTRAPSYRYALTSPNSRLALASLTRYATSSSSERW